MLYDCKKAHEAMVMELFKKLSYINEDDISCIVVGMIAKDGTVGLAFADGDVNDLLLLAGYLQMRATCIQCGLIDHLDKNDADEDKNDADEDDDMSIGLTD